jgi:uncharacterized protein YraI
VKISKMLCALASVLAFAPVASFAQQYANLARDANLRAGPSRDYPVVAELPAGMSVWVDGCINGYRWCDVTVGPDRGWIYAGNIIYPYQGARVPLLNYGAVIGIGIVAFSVGDYWDNHYRTRPWYPQRQNWIDRPRPIYRPDLGNGRPFPPGPPGRPDGMHRPPPGQPAVNMPHPPQRPPPPPGQMPPPSRPLGAISPPPHVVTPGGAQPRPQAQRPSRPSRPPEGQAPREAQRPPQGQLRGGDKRPPWDETPGGGKK